MQIKNAILLATCSALLNLTLTAQNTPPLKDVQDPMLPQLMKEHKNIRFVTVTEKGRPVVKFYQEPTRNAVASLPVQQEFSNATPANFHLTKDINAQTDANPVNSDFLFNRPYAILNNVMYFAASDGIHGTEFWRSDGTTAGTYLVKDLAPGSASASPYEIITGGNKLFFVTADYASFSYRLWTSDGTAAGTVQLKDLIQNGTGVNGSYFLTDVSGTVYFFIRSAFTGATELWKTNGTIGGTVPVKNYINIADAPLEHAAAGGLLYFTMYNADYGRALWRSDGTDAGTFLVKDISPSADFIAGSPFQLTPFNNKLYFSADDGSGRKLWLTNGTPAGTTIADKANNILLQDDYSFAFTNTPFAVQGGHLYLQASAPATGSELYKYNVAAGFSLVRDITPGPAGGSVYAITPAFGNIAFGYNDTVAKRLELWVTDGTVNTFLLKGYNYGEAYFDKLTPGNDHLLYFTSNAGGKGYELWKTNGTKGGTLPVKDIYTGPVSSSPADLTYFNNRLYFTAASKISGTELWQSEGTAATTGKVAEINQSATSYSGPNFFSGTAYGNSAGSAVNHTLYFSAYTPETGYELYKSDGTNSSTSLAGDIIMGENGTNPRSFTTRHGAVYFIAGGRDSTGKFYYNNIYRTDSMGKTMVVAYAPDSYIYTYEVAENGLVYYVQHRDFAFTNELWRSDGTPGGNFMLTDKAASYDYSFPIKTIGNKAYFTATDDKGNELWSSNGTVAGTNSVKDINAGGAGSNPYALYVYNNNLFFGADDGTGIAFWRSNGTAAGTVKIKNIRPYGANFEYGYNNYFCVANNTLYLNANTPETGTELWKTNGTSAGTVLVKDLTGDAGSSNPAYLTNVNGNVFFSALGNQLWKSGGTKANTVLVKSIVSNDYTLFMERCVADGKLFFNTNKLLWVSDGTATGTLQVADNGLNGVSLVTNLAAAGNTVFFNGYTDTYSYELYAGDATKVMVPVLAGNRLQAQKQASFTATVLQNPVAGALNMQVTSDKNQSLTITVSNGAGNIIVRHEAAVNKGSNRIAIPAGNWQAGVYMVKLYNSRAAGVSITVLK